MMKIADMWKIAKPEVCAMGAVGMVSAISAAVALTEFATRNPVQGTQPAFASLMSAASTAVLAKHISIKQSRLARLSL